jgi:hypothetical protein
VAQLNLTDAPVTVLHTLGDAVNTGNLTVTSDRGLYGQLRLGSLTGNSLTGRTTVMEPGSLHVTAIQQDRLDANGEVRIRGYYNGSTWSPSTSEVNALNIGGTTGAWTGTLDINQNYVVIHNATSATVATVQDQLHSGANLDLNGWWDGKGITSSTAALDGSGVSAVGMVDNSQFGYTEFGEANNLTGSEVLLRLTYWGDADLSGTVDIENDFFWWSNGYLGAGTGWLFGDFNYDGVVDIENDFFWWSNGYLSQSTPLPTDPGNTPEPGTLVLLALGGLAILRHRRRR